MPYERHTEHAPKLYIGKHPGGTWGTAYVEIHYDGEFGPSFYGIMLREHAEAVISAMNSQPALLAACEDALETLTGCDGYREAHSDEIATLRAALALARGDA